LLSRSLDTDISAPLAAWGVTLLRVGAGGLIFYIHGWHKLVTGLTFLREGGTWQLVEEIGGMHFPVPVVAAFAATGVQLVCSLFLILGFGTRLSAAVLTVVLGGAIAQNLIAGRDPQLAVLYMLVAAAFIFVGGGRCSVDARLAARERREGARHSPAP
jgi:putative oxidoreductase